MVLPAGAATAEGRRERTALASGRCASCLTTPLRRLPSTATKAESVDYPVSMCQAFKIVAAKKVPSFFLTTVLTPLMSTTG